jgi:FKBP-type peptidyl-prolyl cis-trans isomerase (trigger factor)
MAAIAGCPASEQAASGEFLIRVGEAVITEVEFNKAFEIAKAAYPHNIMQNPEDYREARIRLFNQMTEELILLERARELNISVSDEEVEKSIARIKADYPDDEVFEQTLLEYAVSYKTWKKGLETRLLMEKLVEQELKDQIVITPAEIAKYYKENYGHENQKPGPAENSKEIDEIIIKHLRRKKTEKLYRSWIEKIQKRYKIEINQKKWEKILSS